MNIHRINGVTRLNINIPESWKHELKKIADKHNTTVTKIVMQEIVKRIIRERNRV